MKKKLCKFIAYALVGVFVSTACISSYDEARTVKAVAVVDDTIIIATLLGAMGIVYIGTYWCGSNLAEDWYPDYGKELGEVENNISNIWDSELYTCYLDGRIPNPDDFDPENDDPEDKPPTWEKLKAWMKAHPTQSLAIGTTTLLGGIFASVASQFEEKVNAGEYYNGLVSSQDYNILKDSLSIYPYLCIIRHRNWVDGKYEYLMFKESISFYIDKYPSGGKMEDAIFSNMYSEYKYCRNSSIDDMSIGYVYADEVCYGLPDWEIVGGVIPLYNSKEECPESYTPNTVIHLDNNTVKYSSNPRGDEYGNIILPHEEIAPVGQVQLAPLLDALYNANQASDAEQAEQLKQHAVDNFISSLQNPQPNPDLNPEPNPDPGTDPDPGADPDIDNGSFLADLKTLFPFCIPFDLVDCFRLFNAEPVTPRVEIPIHFGIVEKDYTFVIDLSDFDGVAKVCRSMFLVLFMSGLIMSTRNLIRG